MASTQAKSAHQTPNSTCIKCIINNLISQPCIDPIHNKQHSHGSESLKDTVEYPYTVGGYLRHYSINDFSLANKQSLPCMHAQGVINQLCYRSQKNRLISKFQGRQKENGSGGTENLHAQMCAENVHLPCPLLLAHTLKTQFVIHIWADLSWMFSYSYNSTLAMPDTVHHWYGDLWFARVCWVVDDHIPHSLWKSGGAQPFFLKSAGAIAPPVPPSVLPLYMSCCPPKKVPRTLQYWQ